MENPQATENDLKKRLLKRTAVALVLLAGLIGSLAIFDRLNAPDSEPETQAMVDFIQGVSATAVVFWEAKTTAGLSSPGACNGPSQVSVPLAQSYGIAAGYPIADFENLTNQTLNGDGTNWLDGQGIPAIAIILPDYVTVDWGDNLDGIRAVLRDFGS